MKILHTPEERFVDLPDYAFEPHHVTVGRAGGEPLRMHYVDEGPRTAPPVLLLHGEPTWSYLYRSVIPVLTAAGLRAIAPDHIGFGRSDKLARSTDYSFEAHVGWIRRLVEELDLREITVVGQDWGGPIGFGVLAEQEPRFARAVAANTILPTLEPQLTEGVLEWLSPGLLGWVTGSQRMPEFPVGQIVSGVCVRPLAREVIAAYDAPFPDESYKAAARAFPILIPITPDDPGAQRNRATWKVLERFEKPFLTAYSDSDPATRGWERIFQQRIPGARGIAHATIQGAGHFLQEERGPELAHAIVSFIEATSAGT